MSVVRGLFSRVDRVGWAEEGGVCPGDGRVTELSPSELLMCKDRVLFVVVGL